MGKYFKSPLDFTERQIQNLIVLCGLGIAVYWAATDFNPDKSFLSAIIMMMFGQRLITLKRGSDAGSSPKVDESTKSNEKMGGDPPSSGPGVSNRRRGLRFSSTAGGKRQGILPRSNRRTQRYSGRLLGFV